MPFATEIINSTFEVTRKSKITPKEMDPSDRIRLNRRKADKMRYLQRKKNTDIKHQFFYDSEESSETIVLNKKPRVEVIEEEPQQKEEPITVTISTCCFDHMLTSLIDAHLIALKSGNKDASNSLWEFINFCIDSIKVRVVVKEKEIDDEEMQRKLDAEIERESKYEELEEWEERQELLDEIKKYEDEDLLEYTVPTKKSKYRGHLSKRQKEKRQLVKERKELNRKRTLRRREKSVLRIVENTTPWDDCETCYLNVNPYDDCFYRCDDIWCALCFGISCDNMW